jgi:4-amino-4-deoxy-L-arabinose transferase-like glycosyltransferase
MSILSRRVSGSLWLQAAIVLLFCAGAYWVGLTRIGLTYTEGHRAIPGWEMLEHGEYLVPRLFGQITMRKPPGMYWAVALSSSILGETELAARAVSALAATASALLAFAFATCWFGRPWGLAAGLLQSLTLLFLSSARAAEIESLNNLATQASVFILLDIMLGQSARPVRQRIGFALAGAAAITLMGLAKGPASAPCLFGAIAAALLVKRTWRILARAELLGAMGLAAGVLGAIAWLMFHAVSATKEPVIWQGVDEFLWIPGRTLRVLTLGPTALLYALPLSLGLLFPWGRDARDEARNAGQADSLAMAQAIALACLVALLVYTIAGVSNPRYAIPTVTFISPLMAYVARGWLSTGPNRFIGYRRLSAQVIGLGHPAVWPIIAACVTAGYLAFYEPRLGQTSGRDAGITLAEQLPDGAELWANELIETRPEVLFYAKQAAARAGRTINVRWMWQRDTPAPIGTWVLLRTDEDNKESLNGFGIDPAGRLEPIASDTVHKWSFTLYRVVPKTTLAPLLIDQDWLQPW